MKPEQRKQQIVEILKKQQDKIIFNAAGFEMGVIYDDYYDRIASEISQKQEEEMKEAIELLKELLNLTMTFKLAGEVEKFIKEHEK